MAGNTGVIDTGNIRVDVTTGSIHVALTDGLGNPITSLNGAIDIHDADVHEVPMNEIFHRHTGTNTTLSVAATAGDVAITVTSAVGFSVGDVLQLENGVIETTFPVITIITGTDFTLDRPLDQSMPIGATVDQIQTNMNVLGTLASPVSFKLVPDNGQEWHVISFILSATFATAPADDLFGNLVALINGCTLRGYNGTTGTFRTFTNWKSNADIKLDMYDVPYTDKAGGTNHGMNGNGDIKNRTGAAPHVDGTAGDYLELLIQDDLTSLATFRLKAQGHIEGL